MWLISFSDMLMLLLAFFILRLAISPYRQGKVIDDSNSTFKELNIIRFKKIGEIEGIRSIIGTDQLPEDRSKYSFAVREELGTLARAFGGNDYTFRISALNCGSGFNDEIDRKSSVTVNSVVSQFIDDGVSKECLIVSNFPEQSALCSQNLDASSNENSSVVITIEQRRCNPL
jgi:flagellar motor protein MotB